MARKDKYSKEKKRQEAHRKAKAQLRSQPKVFRMNPGLKESLDPDLPLVACLINQDWQESREAVVSLVRKAPAGMLVATYQVDLKLHGFVNAWGYSGLTEEQVEEMRKDFTERKGPIIDLEIALARQIIWGGVQWARDEGFKYPKDAELWLKALGEMEPDQKPDWSMFGESLSTGPGPVSDE